MQHATPKPTRTSEEIATSEALARLVELGLIDVDVVSVDATSTLQPMYRLGDRFTTSPNSH